MGPIDHEETQPIIVFVCLGPGLPAYLVENLLRTRKLFPSSQVVLITDVFRKCKKLKDLQQYLVSDLSKNYDSVLKSIGRDASFRSGFWQYTILRYFALYEFLLAHKKNSLLYIESDVWISQNFPIKKFTGLNRILLPFSTETQGVASTLFIPNVEIAKVFIDFISKDLKQNPEATDNDILGRCLTFLDDKVIGVLPSYIPTNESVSESFRDQTIKNLNFFDGIFDAASWGQYFTGLDPMNSGGWMEIYRDQSHHLVKPSSYLIRLESNNLIFVTKELKTVPLYSLHVHSKDKRVFKNEKFLNTRFSRYSKKPISEFIFRVYVKLFISRLVSKWHRITK